MADRFYIQYTASATPVEQLGAADDSQSMRLVHSDIDKSVGGGKEIDCGAAAAGVGHTEYLTTAGTSVHLDTISGLTLTNIDFLMVKIKAAADDDGVCDCFIEIGSQKLSYLILVGDACMLRPLAEEGNTIKIYSSAGKLCTVDIMWGLEA